MRKNLLMGVCLISALSLHGLCNFNLGWHCQPAKVYYEIGVFGKNIFDQKYIVDAGNSGRNIGFPTFIGGARSVIGVPAKIGF